MDIKDVRLGVIGFGNMGSAIIDGFLYTKTLLPASIYVSGRSYEKLVPLTNERDICPCKTASDVVANSNLIILAVKPDVAEKVIDEIKDKLEGKVLLSIVNRFGFAEYENILPKGSHHISAIPNTPVSVGNGIFATENLHSLDEDELTLYKELFSKIAIVEFFESDKLDIATILGGCSPAFASMFIEALGDVGVQYGLKRDVAYRLAGQMLSGTGKLLVETKKHPAKMKDEVCSPGGTSIIGVTTLEEKGFRAAIIDAVKAIKNS